MYSDTLFSQIDHLFLQERVHVYIHVRSVHLLRIPCSVTVDGMILTATIVISVTLQPLPRTRLLENKIKLLPCGFFSYSGKGTIRVIKKRTEYSMLFYVVQCCTILFLPSLFFPLSRPISGLTCVLRIE